jgi:hypothetical protein
MGAAPTWAVDAVFAAWLAGIAALLSVLWKLRRWLKFDCAEIKAGYPMPDS